MSEFQTMILVTTVLGMVVYVLLLLVLATVFYPRDESEESLWKNLVMVLVPLLIVVPAAISIDKHLCVNDKLYFVG